jgi:hypothetical protein
VNPRRRAAREASQSEMKKLKSSTTRGKGIITWNVEEMGLVPDFVCETLSTMQSAFNKYREKIKLKNEFFSRYSRIAATHPQAEREKTHRVLTLRVQSTQLKKKTPHLCVGVWVLSSYSTAIGNGSPRASKKKMIDHGIPDMNPIHLSFITRTNNVQKSRIIPSHHPPTEYNTSILCYHAQTGETTQRAIQEPGSDGRRWK